MPGKTDNGDFEAKALVRSAAVDAAGAGWSVLDCYAGEGHMHDTSWEKASRYLGIDKRFMRPTGHASGECWRGDNLLLVGRAMAVHPWTIVDLDAYANPWPLLRRVAQLSKQRSLVVTATCGMDRAIQSGTSDFAVAVAGAQQLGYLGLITRWYDDVVRWAIAWALDGSGFTVRHARRIAGEHNYRMRYYLLELTRKT